MIREVGTPEQQQRFLSDVASGATAGTVALADHPRAWALDDVTMTAEKADGGWVLDGTKVAVLAGEGITEVIVVARVGEGLGAFVVPAAEAGLVPVHSLDASRPLATATLDRVLVGDDRALGEPGSAASTLGISRAVQEATVGLALETVGAVDALFQLVLAYIKDRKQFDVAIGSFQAIKHKMSNMFLSLERARVLCYFAVAAINEDAPARATAVAMAKAASDDCQNLVCRESIQTLGGIGFTWEHDGHFYVKRATSDGALFGSAAAHSLAVFDSLDVTSDLTHGRLVRCAPVKVSSLHCSSTLTPKGAGTAAPGWPMQPRGPGPRGAPSTTCYSKASARRRTASTPPSSGTSTTATRSSSRANGPTAGAMYRCSGPTWGRATRRRSWSTRVSGSRPGPSGATPWSVPP